LLTISNLFRYEGRSRHSGKRIDISSFNQPLHLDIAEQTLDVQGLATYESIVDFTLPLGFLPTVTPELKHITIGGATVGVGIETNSYRYGFVHDGLLEADVLLLDGSVVLCTPNNEYADLFYGLPNSYGTLGYILRAKIQLRTALAYVELHTQAFSEHKAFLAAMQHAASARTIDYVEGLVYGSHELYLVTSRETNQPHDLTSIYGSTIFYKAISQPGTVCVTTKDYIFRYDPEWFWAIPESPLYAFFRSYAPRACRNSAFYAHYVAWQRALSAKLPYISFEDDRLEQLIQDWEVPWKHASALLQYALDSLDLDGKPLLAAPLKTPARAAHYPMLSDELYLNLGSYNYVKKQAGKPAYASTKAMDEFCFKHDGIKMLYSTTFLDEPAFNRIYNGAHYAKLKQKYDPHARSPTLYEKVVKAR
jgi:FAD/FMN-containing dehydrogenase